MGTHHWLLIVVAVLAGYALARFFPAPGQAIGLP